MTVTYPRFRFFVALCVAIVAALLATQALAASSARADTAPEYDSIPAVYPPSFASLGYQATSTSEFGDEVQLAGTDRVLETVTVGLTNWACESDFTLVGDAWTPGGGPCVSAPGSSFSHPITLNIYAVDNSGAAPVPSTLIATLTQNVTVPFRPSANPGVGAGLCGTDSTKWFNAATATCHNGFSFNVLFDFSASGPVLPDDIIVTVAYNTQTHGASPLGVAGPYNSLNVSVANDAATTGTDVDAATMILDSTWGGAYGDGGASGTGTLRADDGNGWETFNGLVLRIHAAATFDPPTLALPDGKTAALAATGSESPASAVIGFGALLLLLGASLVLARAVRARRAV